MKFIVWRRFRCLFIGLIILIIVILFIAILLYSLPVRTHRAIQKKSVLSVICSQLAGGRVKQCDHMLQMLSPDKGRTLIVLFYYLFQNYISMKIVKPLA